MAELKLGNIKPVGADNVVVESKYVKGSYVVVSSIAERDALKGSAGENIIEGSLCYCTADSKFYQYDGAAWTEKEFGTTSLATESSAGLMSPADKKTLTNVVLEGDPRLTDARTPIAHNQAATTITEDDTHRFVSDTEKAAWNAKATTGYVDEKVAAMVDSAPETLDTLNELAAALGGDENFAATVANQIGSKADKTHEHPELISYGTADPSSTITSQFYFKYSIE